ncbi:MAG: PTS transporter subunit EIIC [Lactobacillus sp.]|jgi:PTS system cellobiose-specific IIC component|nr:PTS transporter subunit EIIC [Lactobacillus sp.]MCI2033644.1 PTS transporter subunit EIIC [Lactobacillus sp.]
MKNLYHAYAASRFHHVLQATFTAMLPVIIIGTWAQALLVSVFSRNSFFATVFGLAHWLPGFVQLHIGLDLLVTYTLGISGVLAAVFAANAMATANRRLAAILGGSGFLLLNTSPLTTFGQNLGLDGLLPGFLFGLLCGWWVARSRHPQRRVAGFLVVLAALRVGLNSVEKVTGPLLAAVWPSASDTHQWPFLAALGNSICGWLGLPAPVSPLSPLLANGTATANLNAVLANKAVPYLDTIGTLYRPFALLGGVGMALALIIAILIADHRPDKRRLAKTTLVPSLVGLSWPILLGYSVILEPLLLIPFILAPLAATGIAWLALHTHLMASAVYQVPATTPGPLIAWLATNGNWPALVVTLLGLAVAVLIYLPFVKRLVGGELHA